MIPAKSRSCWDWKLRYSSQWQSLPLTGTQTLPCAFISPGAGWLIPEHTLPVTARKLWRIETGLHVCVKFHLRDQVGSTETWRGSCYCPILENEQTKAEKGDLTLEDCKGKDLHPWPSGSLGGKTGPAKGFLNMIRIKKQYQCFHSMGQAPGRPFHIHSTRL